MELISLICLLGFALVVPVYVHTFKLFYEIIKSEKPEWLEAAGSKRLIYNELQSIGNPNVQLEIVKIAYSSRASELKSPFAKLYAKKIRLALPIGLLLFLAGVVGMTSAP